VRKGWERCWWDSVDSAFCYSLKQARRATHALRACYWRMSYEESAKRTEHSDHTTDLLHAQNVQSNAECPSHHTYQDPPPAARPPPSPIATLPGSRRSGYLPMTSSGGTPPSPQATSPRLPRQTRGRSSSAVRATTAAVQLVARLGGPSISQPALSTRACAGDGPQAGHRRR